MTDNKSVVVPSDDWRGIAKRSATGPSERRTGLHAEVILLLDCSGSMDGKSLGQARVGAADFAKQAVADGWTVGLICFDYHARFACLPTRDLKAFSDALPWSADGGTAMHLGIDAAIEHLQSLSRRKAVCIVSDGVPDDKAATLQSAAKAKRHGIEILIIGIEGADMIFLSQLATRRDLSKTATQMALPSAMRESAKLLPPILALPKRD